MSLKICGSCLNHYQAAEISCPHCGTSRVALNSTPWAVLLGLTLGACGGAEKDTAEDTSVAPQPEMQAAYGVPEGSDVDGDGFWAEDGDCNDEDPDIYPGAPETAGDGVDSNCDGEDDT